jgi:hypothetical protein
MQNSGISVLNPYSVFVGCWQRSLRPPKATGAGRLMLAPLDSVLEVRRSRLARRTVSGD